MTPKVNKIWIDSAFVYIQTDKGEIYKEKFDDYPRLRNATPLQRADFEHDNIGIRWESIDEDLSYSGFINTYYNKNGLESQI